jgi:hypothetical protein
MKLTVTHRGAVLSELNFWKDTDEVETGRVTLLTGSNGSGKTATIHSIMGPLDLFDNCATDGYLNPGFVKKTFGTIALDEEFDVYLKYRGDRVSGLPGALNGELDIRRTFLGKRSHGTAALNLIAEHVLAPMMKALDEGKRVLIFLDEPEAGLSPEAADRFAQKLAQEVENYESLYIIIATQSSSFRRELLEVGGAEHDFGGWVFGPPPWRIEELKEQYTKRVERLAVSLIATLGEIREDPENAVALAEVALGTPKVAAFLQIMKDKQALEKKRSWGLEGQR